ncbi:hypothetical protein EYF80_061363 [Liparis tanakae]|uniref:Uncharacterized protein n=1 Tax=Liparis tanakae TaxID=230148 RepID=A0A4Z2EI66_9TELE|nr:hypothetical protein EYF80_061363 [Liparis tanakae]
MEVKGYPHHGGIEYRETSHWRFTAEHDHLGTAYSVGTGLRLTTVTLEVAAEPWTVPTDLRSRYPTDEVNPTSQTLLISFGHVGVTKFDIKSSVQPSAKSTLRLSCSVQRDAKSKEI